MSNVSGTGRNQLISDDQMNWLKDGLLASNATFKVIAAHQPISDLVFDRTLSTVRHQINHIGMPLIEKGRRDNVVGLGARPEDRSAPFPE